jgi:hypothetical protein
MPRFDVMGQRKVCLQVVSTAAARITRVPARAKSGALQRFRRPTSDTVNTEPSKRCAACRSFWTGTLRGWRQSTTPRPGSEWTRRTRQSRHRPSTRRVGRHKAILQTPKRCVVRPALRGTMQPIAEVPVGPPQETQQCAAYRVDRPCEPAPADSQSLQPNVRDAPCLGGAQSCEPHLEPREPTQSIPV